MQFIIARELFLVCDVRSVATKRIISRVKSLMPKLAIKQRLVVLLFPIHIKEKL